MNNIVKLNLKELTSGQCNRNTPRDIKMKVIGNTINFKHWNFLGFDANGSVVKIQPRFHNIRDKFGRFKKK